MVYSYNYDQSKGKNTVTKNTFVEKWPGFSYTGTLRSYPLVSFDTRLYIASTFHC